MTPQGAPPDTLAAVLGAFVANAGKMPQVNPPEAPKVLAGPTALEVAGHPEPEKAPEPAPAPVEKPADVLAAEQARSKRRTAAVVQAELDAALQKVADLEAKVSEQATDLLTLQSQAQGEYAVNDSGAGPVDERDAALAEAVELIQSLQGEAKISAEDNAKAWARVATVEAERDEALAQNAANVALFEQKLAQQQPAVNAIAGAQPFTLNQAICLVRELLPPGACEIKIAAHGYFKP